MSALWLLTVLSAVALFFIFRSLKKEPEEDENPRYILKARFLQGQLSEGDFEELLEGLDPPASKPLFVRVLSGLTAVLNARRRFSPRE